MIVKRMFQAVDRTEIVMLTLVGILALLPYVNILDNGFAFDDIPLVVENDRIRSLDNITNLVGTRVWADKPVEGGIYRPLVMLTLALNYAWGGLDPFGYHLFNLLVHAGVCLLLYLVGRRLLHSRAGALVAAGLFAVHPLHTEAVAQVVGRADLLAAAGFLLAWVLYLDHQDRPLRLAVSLAAFAAALFSKEHAAVLPALLIVTDLYRYREGQRPLHAAPEKLNGRQKWRIIARHVPYWAVLGGYLGVRGWVSEGLIPTGPEPFVDNPLAHEPMLTRWLTALAVAGRYLWLMVWPRELTTMYGYAQIPVVDTLWHPGVLASLLAWGALAAAAVWSYGRARVVLLAVSMTVATFLPVANLLFPIGTIMGERLFYLPSAGLCLLVGILWEASKRWISTLGEPILVQRVAIGLLLVVGVALGARTVIRNQEWQSNAALIQATAEVSSRSVTARAALAEHYAREGKLGKAIEEWKRSVEIYPTFKAYRNLGDAYVEQGDLDEAIRIYQNALSIRPQQIDVARNLGTAYLRRGQVEKAISTYRQALLRHPDDPELYVQLGYALLEEGSAARAIESLQNAVRLDPQQVDAYFLLGESFRKRSDWSGAVDAYQRAATVRQDFWQAHYMMGRTLEAAGHPSQAAEAYRKSLRIKPDLQAARQRLERLRESESIRTPGRIIEPSGMQ